MKKTSETLPYMDWTPCYNISSSRKERLTNNGLNDGTLPSVLTSNSHDHWEHVVVDLARDILETLEALGQDS